ncbi:MAG: HopJ type III effector protein [Pseudomonadales bacterium]|nr:HopJ type III effector protein [Pseudomonadales bacterium]
MRTFLQVLHDIDTEYLYTPATFYNGLGHAPLVNLAGTNEGSCRVFTYALLVNLDEQQTLQLFAEHYQHVLDHPDGVDHPNVRRFMLDGWPGIRFFSSALQVRPS